MAQELNEAEEVRVEMAAQELNEAEEVRVEMAAQELNEAEEVRVEMAAQRYIEIEEDRGQFDTIGDWYPEWSQLETLLLGQLSSPTEESPSLSEKQGADMAPSPPKKQAGEIAILLPGISKLPENLYDSGYTNLTNIDFAPTTIHYKRSLNEIRRSTIKWKLMDLTVLKFDDKTFHAVIEKGALDSMTPANIEWGTGYRYLCQVKRVLKARGKYVCVTFGKPHVLDLLFGVFRFGWTMEVHEICEEALLRELKQPAFMIVAKKIRSGAVGDITAWISESHSTKHLVESIARERRTRLKYRDNFNLVYSLEDVLLGAQGDVSLLKRDRCFKLCLGKPGISSIFSYKCRLMDSERFTQNIFVICLAGQHKSRFPNQVYEADFSSEDENVSYLMSLGVARLLMVFLDSCTSDICKHCIQDDLIPLIEPFVPEYAGERSQLRFVLREDNTRKTTVHKVKWVSAGIIVSVKDLTYDDGLTRRLIYQRNSNTVQAEVGLSLTASGEVVVDHQNLESPYDNAVIYIILLSSILQVFTSAPKSLIIGLRGGILPMHMRKCLPDVKLVEVIEEIPELLDLAREWFGFTDVEGLKVHIGDALDFVNDKAASEADDEKVDILVIDVDSTDTRCGLTCPPMPFILESFFSAAKGSLSTRGGVFIMNLVSGSQALRTEVYTRLDRVFGKGHIFILQLEEDINDVVFAFKTESPLNRDQIFEAQRETEQIMKSSVKDKLSQKRRRIFNLTL